MDGDKVEELPEIEIDVDLLWLFIFFDSENRLFYFSLLYQGYWFLNSNHIILYFQHLVYNFIFHMCGFIYSVPNIDCADWNVLPNSC